MYAGFVIGAAYVLIVETAVVKDMDSQEMNYE